MAHARQSRPYYGLNFQVKGRKTFPVVPAWYLREDVEDAPGGEGGVHARERHRARVLRSPKL